MHAEEQHDNEQLFNLAYICRKLEKIFGKIFLFNVTLFVSFSIGIPLITIAKKINVKSENVVIMIK